MPLKQQQRCNLSKSSSRSNAERNHKAQSSRIGHDAKHSTHRVSKNQEAERKWIVKIICLPLQKISLCFPRCRRCFSALNSQPCLQVK